MSKLLPCPFCGGEAVYEEDCGMHIISCKSPECPVGLWIVYDAKEQAFTAWNTRPLTTNVPTEPGRYRMTMEVDVVRLPETELCLMVWVGDQLIGTVGSVNNPQHDITAHFERIEEES